MHPLSRALIWYGTCSALAYLVNAYIALRVFGINSTTERIRRVAAWLYLAELCVNWPVHTYLIARAVVVHNASLVATAVYVALTCALVVDDVQLLKYLFKTPKRHGTGCEPVLNDAGGRRAACSRIPVPYPIQTTLSQLAVNTLLCRRHVIPKARHASSMAGV